MPIQSQENAQEPAIVSACARAKVGEAAWQGCRGSTSVPSRRSEELGE
jgi:hypothetical protein